MPTPHQRQVSKEEIGQAYADLQRDLVALARHLIKHGKQEDAEDCVQAAMVTLLSRYEATPTRPVPPGVTIKDDKSVDGVLFRAIFQTAMRPKEWSNAVRAEYDDTLLAGVPDERADLCDDPAEAFVEELWPRLTTKQREIALLVMAGEHPRSVDAYTRLGISEYAARHRWEEVREKALSLIGYTAKTGA